MRDGMRIWTLAAVLCAATLSAGPGAVAAEPAGWRAGPAADATMEKGRPFVCEGADCPSGGLVCLHAVSPGAPGKGRTLRVHDMLRPKSFPWKDYEIWLATKLGDIRPQLQLATGALAAAEPARLARISERDFMRRSYEARAASEREAVEVALWVTDNQLNSALCALKAVDLPVASARIEAFFDAMNLSPATPPYDPLAAQ